MQNLVSFKMFHNSVDLHICPQISRSEVSRWVTSVKLFFCIGESKMSGLEFSVSASLCPCLHRPSSDCGNCKPLSGGGVRNNPIRTAAPCPLKARLVWKGRLFAVWVGEWQLLQVGFDREVSPEVSSGAQRRGPLTCTWLGEVGRGTASSCQKHWRRSRKNCALRDSQLCKSPSEDYLSDER